jgi:hypothetical protein
MSRGACLSAQGCNRFFIDDLLGGFALVFTKGIFSAMREKDLY